MGGFDWYFDAHARWVALHVPPPWEDGRCYEWRRPAPFDEVRARLGTWSPLPVCPKNSRYTTRRARRGWKRSGEIRCCLSVGGPDLP